MEPNNTIFPFATATEPKNINGKGTFPAPGWNFSSTGGTFPAHVELSQQLPGIGAFGEAFGSIWWALGTIGEAFGSTWSI